MFKLRSGLRGSKSLLMNSFWALGILLALHSTLAVATGSQAVGVHTASDFLFDPHREYVVGIRHPIQVLLVGFDGPRAVDTEQLLRQLRQGLRVRSSAIPSFVRKIENLPSLLFYPCCIL